MIDPSSSNRARGPIIITPVGVMHSPYKAQKEAPRQGRDSPTLYTIEIYPEYAPAMGTMEGITHIWILYWMDRAERDLLLVRRLDWSEARPVFTIRSPARPNPIALSIGKIIGIEGLELTVTGIEALDGSPVIDIKPYIRDLDCIELNPDR
jgi:tRNA-Thr(GGU) m(6)t(6)A37 methyltransferase TsaA